MSEAVAQQSNIEVNREVINQPETTSTPIVRICSHIKDDGIRCGTPALNGRPFCYYHSRAHHVGTRLGQRGYRASLQDTIESLQLTIMQVTEALGSGRISDKTAGKILWGVQISANLLKTKAAQSASNSELFVTEIPQAMEEALAPSEPSDDVAVDLDLVPEKNDPEMPATVEEARRALFEPQQLIDFFKAFRKCDQMTPRYKKFERRLQLHQRAYDVLLANGINMDDYINDIGSVPN
jgi:hypothetical protein